jgi:CDP-diacylglycerol--glycerol-3-phosphate 3-phosphatidyltransferase
MSTAEKSINNHSRPATQCDHHGCWHEPQDIWLTWANLVTAVRTIGCVVLVMLAIAQHSTPLLFAGLLVYWIGDMADGMVARWLKRETRIGGSLDILCDRLCVALFYMTYATWHHAMLIPIAIFMVQFMVLDNFLTLSFLHWPLKSPNYFYLVDRIIYKWNWSPPAKALNSSALVLVMVITKSPVAAGILAAAIFTLKVVSLRRLQRIGLPEVTGCAALSS